MARGVDERWVDIEGSEGIGAGVVYVALQMSMLTVNAFIFLEVSDFLSLLKVIVIGGSVIVTAL